MSTEQHLRISVIAGWIVCAGLLGVAGCQRGSQPALAATPEAAAPEAAPVAPMVVEPSVSGLDDIIERSPSYVVGISFPQHLESQPGLEKLIRDYADGARAELKQAVQALGSDRPSAPYELSLRFDTLFDTPTLVAVAADGSAYTGGAHGVPLVARFVWLKSPAKPLTAAELIPDPGHWATVAEQVAARLHEAALVRIQAGKLSPDEQRSLLQSADKMIAEGTVAKPDNFAQFEPLLDASGRITALRFVFPPYQVGPYSDGTQTADVPANVLRPLVAPEYAELFTMN